MKKAPRSGSGVSRPRRELAVQKGVLIPPGVLQKRLPDVASVVKSAMTASTSKQEQPAAETLRTSRHQGPPVQRMILNPFRCDICKQGFRTRRELNQHDYDVHFHQCNYCKQIFADNLLLLKHRSCCINRKIHLKLERKLVEYEKLFAPGHSEHCCDICMEEFEDSLALTSHMRFHSAKLKSYSRKPKPNSANSDKQTVQIAEKSGLTDKDILERNVKCELEKSFDNVTNHVERLNDIDKPDRVNDMAKNTGLFTKGIKAEPCEFDESFSGADKIDEDKEHPSNILETKVKCEASNETMKESNELFDSNITDFVEGLKGVYYEEFDAESDPSKLLEMKVKSEIRDEEMISNVNLDGIVSESSKSGLIKAESFTRDEDMKKHDDILNDPESNAKEMSLGFHEDDFNTPSVSLQESKRFDDVRQECSENNFEEPSNKEFEKCLMEPSEIEDPDKIGMDGDVKPFEVVTPEARAALYGEHRVAGDLVLGPVRVRAPDIVYTFRNVSRKKTICKQEPEFTNSPT